MIITNSFPFTLLRRPVSVTPVTVEEARAMARVNTVTSAWGHANTCSHASAVLQVDLTPVRPRIALELSPQSAYPQVPADATGLGVPMWHRQVLIVSPNYRTNFRPAVGQEVAADDIVDWQCLLLQWPLSTTAEASADGERFGIWPDLPPHDSR